jgi:hypothetical protein
MGLEESGCDHTTCPDSGKVGADNIKAFSSVERRSFCATRGHTFSTDEHTSFEALRRPRETVLGWPCPAGCAGPTTSATTQRMGIARRERVAEAEWQFVSWQRFATKRGIGFTRTSRLMLVVFVFSTELVLNPSPGHAPSPG